MIVLSIALNLTIRGQCVNIHTHFYCSILIPQFKIKTSTTSTLTLVLKHQTIMNYDDIFAKNKTKFVNTWSRQRKLFDTECSFCNNKHAISCSAPLLHNANYIALTFSVINITSQCTNFWCNKYSYHLTVIVTPLLCAPVIIVLIRC